MRLRLMGQVSRRFNSQAKGCYFEPRLPLRGEPNLEALAEMRGLFCQLQR
jgi:hypothetical protein